MEDERFILNQRFSDLDYLFTRDSKFAPNDFVPDK